MRTDRCSRLDDDVLQEELLFQFEPFVEDGNSCLCGLDNVLRPEVWDWHRRRAEVQSSSRTDSAGQGIAVGATNTETSLRQRTGLVLQFAQLRVIKRALGKSHAGSRQLPLC